MRGAARRQSRSSALHDAIGSVNLVMEGKLSSLPQATAEQAAYARDWLRRARASYAQGWLPPSPGGYGGQDGGQGSSALHDVTKSSD